MINLQDIFSKYYDYRPFKISLLDKIIGNLSKILKPIANAVLPTYFKIVKGEYIYKKNIRNQNVSDAVICLTSFPKRIKNLWLVMECILRQSMAVKQVVLYLSTEQFPNKLEDLPLTLTKYCKLFLSIVFVDGDIRSHKKYWYAVRDFSDSPIIVIDDDLIYPSDFVRLLTNTAHDNKNCVVSLYSHKMLWDNNGNLAPYSSWLHEGRVKLNTPIEDAFFGSGGGVYYPIGALKGADQNINFIMDCCPLADDIWQNAIVRLNRFKVISPRFQTSVVDWSNHDNETLSSTNNGKGFNDLQLVKTIGMCKRLFGQNPFAKDIFT